MYCKKCGKELSNEAVFCPFCGCAIDGNENREPQTAYNASINDAATMNSPQMATAGIGQTTAYNQNVNGQKSASHNKKTVVIFASLGGIVLAALIVVLIFVLKIQQDDNDHSIIQANMTNWGYAVSGLTGDYYSDGKTGIYSFNNENKRKIIDGSYSDLGMIGGVIFCVEYYEESARVVAFDTTTYQKDIVYTPPASDIQLISKNVLNGKYYFTAGSTLYSVDCNYDVTNTGIKNAIAVTSSGVYTSETDEYGLLLLSFSNKVLHRYDDFSNIKVNSIYFELDNRLYYSTIDEQASSHPIYILDLASEESSVLISDLSLLQNNVVIYLNRKGENFFFSTTTTNASGTFEYRVYITDKNGNNASLIYSAEDGALPFCTLNIVGDYLFIDFPHANINGATFKISTMQQIA